MTSTAPAHHVTDHATHNTQHFSAHKKTKTKVTKPMVSADGHLLPPEKKKRQQQQKKKRKSVGGSESQSEYVMHMDDINSSLDFSDYSVEG